ncbi:hypothetical protein GTR04_7378 [Trichophyton interdigitale]|nr:hypothetical protein GY631_7379 [Trichophyton interdigitale]KAG5216699.1 hypothetical protein GY632_7292 [Trichophyton interdigitale]KAG8205242.1 hypothetical protein GTR04_7378 [Trichophyton interdigitale]
MSAKRAVFTDKAPAPLPVFSQAIVHNGIVYCSGQVGTDPATRELVEGTVKDRTVRVCLFAPSLAAQDGRPSSNMGWRGGGTGTMVDWTDTTWPLTLYLHAANRPRYSAISPQCWRLQDQAWRSCSRSISFLPTWMTSPRSTRSTRRSLTLSPSR